METKLKFRGTYTTMIWCEEKEYSEEIDFTFDQIMGDRNGTPCVYSSLVKDYVSIHFLKNVRVVEDNDE